MRVHHASPTPSSRFWWIFFVVRQRGIQMIPRLSVGGPHFELRTEPAGRDRSEREQQGPRAATQDLRSIAFTRENHPPSRGFAIG